MTIIPSFHCSEELVLPSSLSDHTTAEKDEGTVLELVGTSEKFVSVYGKPLYVINNMSGQPNSLLRLGYPEIDTGLFTDDDFFQYNNITTEFQEFIDGPYSVILKYTGLRWYGESK